MRLLYLRQAKQHFTITLARRGVQVQYTKVCERQSGSLNIRPCLSSAKPQTQRMALWGTLGSAWARLWMYLRYLLYYERCWVVEFRRVHKERAHHWQARERELLEHVSPNTHGARHVSGCLLSEAGLRNVQHAVYVGVEHWRQLHSWPCDGNRNEGNICSSQQQCRTVRYEFTGVCACEVTKRRISRLSSRCSPRRWETKYRNRGSAGSAS